MVINTETLKLLNPDIIAGNFGKKLTKLKGQDNANETVLSVQGNLYKGRKPDPIVHPLGFK